MSFKIAVIGSEKIIRGFEIAGLDKRDGTMFAFDDDQHNELKESFHNLINRNDIGLIFISENFYDALKDEIGEYKKTFPSILKIPMIH